MLHLDARIVINHILAVEKIHERAMSNACKLLSANDENDALNN